MKKNSFKEICENSSRLINEAGLAAYFAVDTDDFIPRFADLLDCFRREFAGYLYAARGIDPTDPRLAEEDNAFFEKTLEEVSVWFRVAAELLDADFVRSFDPVKAPRELPFFGFLEFATRRRADSELARERITETRRGVTGMTREQGRLLSAALRIFESVPEVTDEILAAAASEIGCDADLLRDAWVMNRNSNAESLDAGSENDEGDFISLYDKVASKDEPSDKEDYVQQSLSLLDRLLAFERPKDMRKDEAPFALSKAEKSRFPLLFTNRLILGWIDELRDSDPDADNRDYILKNRFGDLRLGEKLRKYEGHLAVSPLVFSLYEDRRAEVTLGDLAEECGFDRSAFSGLFEAVTEKLALFRVYYAAEP